MIELLKLCGFEAYEIESELPRIEKAFNKIGITDQDIERGRQRLNRYYDMELKGVRKIFRVFIKELVNLMLSREEGKAKIVYGGVGPGFETIGTAIVSKSKEVYAGFPDHLFRTVLGYIFDKMDPILEAAEKRWLKAGRVAHCAEVKGRVGLFALDLVPRPDLVTTTDCICEANPKTHDLIHELYGIPVYYYETCRDSGAGRVDDVKRAVGLGAKAMRRFVERLKDVVGFEITDDLVVEVMRARGRLTNAIAQVRHLMETSDPLVLSATHDSLLQILGGRVLMSADKLQQDPLDAVNTLYEELQERVNKGLGVVEKGAPRVLATMPPSYSGPELDHLAEEVGIAIVASESGLYVPDGRSRPTYTGESKDPYERMFSYLWGSIATNLSDRIPALIGACKRLHVEGVFGRYHIGCRGPAGDALILKRAIIEELGIPVLLLEWEEFDPREYKHEQYKRQLELFRSMMRPA